MQYNEQLCSTVSLDNRSSGTTTNNQDNIKLPLSEAHALLKAFAHKMGVEGTDTAGLIDAFADKNNKMKLNDTERLLFASALAVTRDQETNLENMRNVVEMLKARDFCETIENKPLVMNLTKKGTGVTIRTILESPNQYGFAVDRDQIKKLEISIKSNQQTDSPRPIDIFDRIQEVTPEETSRYTIKSKATDELVFTITPRDIASV